MAFGLAKRYSNAVGGLSRDQKKDALGSVGLRALEMGGHALIALASKNMPGGLFGVPALKPDWAAIVVSGLGVAFAKGKLRRTSRSLLYAGGHALITRWVNTGNVFISGVDIFGNGRVAGETTTSAPPRTQKPPKQETVSATAG